MSVSELIAAFAPQFVSDPRIGTFTTVAMNQTSRCAFGVNYELAVALRVCHLIARNPQRNAGSSGAVTGETEGELSRSYQISPFLMSKYSDLCTTPYGSELAQLIEGNVFGQFVSSDQSTTLLQGDEV